MVKLLSILWNSFRMALQELRVNKLRTFLSLFGITIGIFCIIGVLATVDSLERKVQNDIKSLKSISHAQKQQFVRDIKSYININKEIEKLQEKIDNSADLRDTNELTRQQKAKIDRIEQLEKDLKLIAREMGL